MKAFQLLFIFVLNFKLIFCQFPLVPFFIRNELDNKYLTVINEVLVYTSLPLTNTLWMSDGKFIYHGVTGLVLQAEVSTPGASVVLATRNPFNANQIWSLKVVSPPNKVVINLDNSDLYFTVNNGFKVELDNGSSSQIWNIEEIIE